MLEPPPAYPSSPPPPGEKSSGIRPMSPFGAAMWVGLATFGFLLLVGVFSAVRESTTRDQIGLVMCQVAAYLLALFGILRVHGPDESIRAFVGLRATHPGFYPLGLLTGASASVPATWLLIQLERWWPPDEGLGAITELFFHAGPVERIGIAVAGAALGPLVEELLFRGALVAPLRERHSPGAVVLVTATLFAFVHMEPRTLPPIFLMGLLLGYLRLSTGSLWPPVLMHVGFNTVPFVELFLATGPPVESAAEATIAPWLVLGASAVCAACVGGVWLLARARRGASGRGRG